MIPKIIHYCWFGGNPLPESAIRCINSWRKYCPNYEIKEWNESNFDVNCIPYCQAMYEQKRWAFLTDYVRLKVVYENGGIYMDTDVELRKSLDTILKSGNYVGLETTNLVNTGLGFGAEKGCSFIRENMIWYESTNDFTTLRTCPEITTEVLVKYGFDPLRNEIQHCAGMTIYPTDYFCAKHTHTGLITITENTVSIHHFDATWNTEEEKAKTAARWKYYKKQYILQTPKRAFRKLVGDDTVDAIKRKLGI